MKRALAALAFAVLLWSAPAAELWNFDSLTKIGGHPVTVEGHPHLITTPAGKAIQFGGIDDALFLNIHPLAGAETFTWEVIFRPDVGGAPEQRFFHLQEEGSDNRMLFEIRVVDGQWCLDSFAQSGAESKPLLNREKLHSLGQWHHAAAVYDGREYRNYVDGRLEGAAPLHLAPQKPGRTSLGTRINRKDYFKGAILQARMTRAPLDPSRFLKLPATLTAPDHAAIEWVGLAACTVFSSRGRFLTVDQPRHPKAINNHPKPESPESLCNGNLHRTALRQRNEDPICLRSVFGPEHDAEALRFLVLPRRSIAPLYHTVA